MNSLAKKTFCKEGESLIGKNLRYYHNERSNLIISQLLSTGGSNAYTIEKAGIRKLIKQTVWRAEDGTMGGLVEFSIVLPSDMPHYNRG